MPQAHHTIYAADVELIADAHAKRISHARLEALQPLDEFDSDEEDHRIAQRAVAALGPEVEHFILRSTYKDYEHWVFCTVEDSNLMVLRGVEKPSVISHPPGTSHFLCVCYAHISMTKASWNPNLLAVVDFRRDRNGKYGSCPRCGQVHSVRKPDGPTNPAVG